MSQSVYVCHCKWRGLSVGCVKGRRGHMPDNCPRCGATAFSVHSEQYPQITKTCEDCTTEYLCHRESRWCPNCRWRHRGRTTKKYPWTAERDALLRARYDGRIKGRAAQVAQTFGWPRWVITKRAAGLGLCYPADHRDWTKKEADFASFHAGHRTTHWIAKQLGRTETAVVLKLKHLHISRAIRNGYTLSDLETCFGTDHHVIERWVEKGWLRRRQLSPGTANSKWQVSEDAIVTFIRSHPMAFRLDKVDQLWFMDLVLDGHAVRADES